MFPTGPTPEESVERARKENIVNQLHADIGKAEMVVVTRHEGLTVAEATELRRAMHAIGTSFRVTKNRLALRALGGTPYEGLKGLFKGPTAVACSHDPVSVAKAAVDFAKKNEKLIVLGGQMGNHPLDAAGIEHLAKLPSLDELRGKIVGLLQAPATKVAMVLQAPAGQLARVFGAYGQTGGDAEAGS
jgi:large subunit ribosomal protein L10